MTCSHKASFCIHAKKKKSSYTHTHTRVLQRQSHCWALCHHKRAQQLIILSAPGARGFPPLKIFPHFDFWRFNTVQDVQRLLSLFLLISFALRRCTCDTLLAAAVIFPNCSGGPCTTSESAQMCACLRLIVFDRTWSRGLLWARPSSRQTSFGFREKCPQ